MQTDTPGDQAAGGAATANGSDGRLAGPGGQSAERPGNLDVLPRRSRPSANRRSRSFRRSTGWPRVNAGYGLVDRMTFDATCTSDGINEGRLTFTEKREPAWVPAEYRTNQRR
jgi:hypothetical protein